MERKMKIVASIAVAAVVLLAGAAAVLLNKSSSGSGTDNSAATRQITDMMGRNLTVPTTVHKVIGVNYGALRMITYLNASDLVCGVEQVETNVSGRPYAMAHPEYAKLPVIGPQFTGDAELIASQDPDVVFYTGATVSDLDALQNKIGKPVVGITYGGLGTEAERQTFYDGLSLMGKILNKEDRAQKVIAYVQGIIKDCNDRTKDITDASRSTVYVGGLSSRGNHGFTSTTAYYAPFTMTNSKNVVTADMAKNSTQVVNIDTEAVPGLNPDVIFVDYNGLSLSAQDVKNHPEVYADLNAIKNDRTYGVMGYNWYALNFEVVLTDAYYVGKVLYPTQFSDIDVAQKANEIYSFLDGAPLYEQMTELYGPFSHVSLT